MTLRLPDFLYARLDEDEAAARANIGAGPGWQHGLGDTEDGSPGWPDYQTYDDGIEEASEFISRFRPLRQLREVEAKRGIIRAEMDRALDHGSPGYSTVLLDLGAVYSDHPDYQEEWKP